MLQRTITMSITSLSSSSALKYIQMSNHIYALKFPYISLILPWISCSCTAKCSITNGPELAITSAWRVNRDNNRYKLHSEHCYMSQNLLQCLNLTGKRMASKPNNRGCACISLALARICSFCLSQATRDAQHALTDNAFLSCMNGLQAASYLSHVAKVWLES